MKKTILTAFLMLAVCAGFASSQTKKIVRKSAKGTIAKRTVIRKTKSKTIRKRKIRKMENTNSNAVTTESGLTYIITKNGDGAQIKSGDNVIVNYTGMLTNGAKFDSSLDRNEPFSFPVGAGMVIKGWDEGLQKLRIGDHAILTIPPSIGYGASGAGGVIPPNATLIFIIEVLGVK
jgi:FKBP-type peptidyl-prolyl cis-trans isomerase